MEWHNKKYLKKVRKIQKELNSTYNLGTKINDLIDSITKGEPIHHKNYTSYDYSQLPKSSVKKYIWQQVGKLQYEYDCRINDFVYELNWLVELLTGEQDEYYFSKAVNHKSLNVWDTKYVAYHASKYNLAHILNKSMIHFFTYKRTTVVVNINNGSQTFRDEKQFVPVTTKDVSRLTHFVIRNIKNGHFRHELRKNTAKTETIMEKDDREGDKIQKLINEGKI